MHKTGPRLGLFRVGIVSHIHCFITTTSTIYRSLLASRSDSSRQRMSFSRTVTSQHLSPTSRCRRVRTGALDVADDAAGSVVHELDAALGNTTTGACPSQNSTLMCPLRDCASADDVPVRPRTRVTLTSLTGTLAVSIVRDCTGQHLRRDAAGCGGGRTVGSRATGG